MSLDKVVFLRFYVLIAEEVSINVVIVINYDWVIIIVRNITFTRIIIKHIYTKIRNNTKRIQH